MFDLQALAEAIRRSLFKDYYIKPWHKLLPETRQRYLLAAQSAIDEYKRQEHEEA